MSNYESDDDDDDAFESADEGYDDEQLRAKLTGHVPSQLNNDDSDILTKRLLTSNQLIDDEPNKSIELSVNILQLNEKDSDVSEASNVIQKINNEEINDDTENINVNRRNVQRKRETNTKFRSKESVVRGNKLGNVKKINTESVEISQVKERKITDDNQCTNDTLDSSLTKESQKHEEIRNLQHADDSDNRSENIETNDRRLLRNVQRQRNATAFEGKEISDDKREEVLNKLGNMSASKGLGWNNWFSDVTSAAAAATTATANRASNWSFNPKNILSAAANITNTVAENVSSVVDSAIGAPPPEELASSLANSKSKDTAMTNEPDKNSIDSDGSKFGFGFVNFTLDTLETIGKKTMNIIVEDKNRTFDTNVNQTEKKHK